MTAVTPLMLSSMLDFSFLPKYAPYFIKGAEYTLILSACAVFLAVVPAFALALMRLSRRRALRLISGAYIALFRSTPMLVQLSIVYFGLFGAVKLPSVYLFGFINAAMFVPGVVALALNSAAYVAEIFRAGIQSIEVGQMRAGLSLGMTWGQTMRYIILPQAFKRIIPPLGNEFIAMLKDSSLVSVIGFEELTRTGQLIIAETYGSLEIWTSVAIIYLVMTLTITRLVSRLEKKFKASDAR